ncbi:MAG: Plug domain-containing protein, partial [Candidatus Omnitrophica bacterium]|nr:Plug domain-containing protein [Candidatus Omnitrophota bacterium]
MNMLFIFCIIVSLFFSSPAFAKEAYTLEKIVVKASGGASGLDVQSFTAADIKEKKADSLVDLLDQFSGVDLRSRSPWGIQADLSLRGSTYEQVAVLIDGLRVIDPQTGHHNLDIPLTYFDLERVEAIKEGSSALYGPGALAGSLNFIVKKPAKKAFNLDTFFGEHALFGQASSFSLAQESLSTRVS